MGKTSAVTQSMEDSVRGVHPQDSLSTVERCVPGVCCVGRGMVYPGAGMGRPARGIPRSVQEPGQPRLERTVDGLVIEKSPFEPEAKSF